MTTLTIKDLPLVEEMEYEAMAEVRGGMTYGEAFKMVQQAAEGDCAVVGNNKGLACIGEGTVTPIK